MTKLVIVPQVLLARVYNFYCQTSEKPKQKFLPFFELRESVKLRKDGAAGSRQQAKDEVISFGRNSCRSRQEGGKKCIYVLDGININPQFYPDGVISQVSFYNTQFGGKMVNFCTGSYL